MIYAHEQTGSKMAEENSLPGFGDPHFDGPSVSESTKWKSISLTHVVYPQGIV